MKFDLGLRESGKSIEKNSGKVIPGKDPRTM